MRRRVFLSYAHADAPRAVVRLARALRRHGWDVWLDRDEVLRHGHLCTSLASGLRTCDALVPCLGAAYCAKVQAAAEHPGAVADNCLRELVLATALRLPVVPACLDPDLFDDPRRWGDVLCMHLGAHVRVDASARSTGAAARLLHARLCAAFGGGAWKRRVLRSAAASAHHHLLRQRAAARTL